MSATGTRAALLASSRVGPRARATVPSASVTASEQRLRLPEPGLEIRLRSLDELSGQGSYGTLVQLLVQGYVCTAFTKLQVTRRVVAVVVGLAPKGCGEHRGRRSLGMGDQ